MPTLDVAGVPVSVSALLLLGGVVGLTSGLYGVGGAFLLTPLLVSVLGVPLPIAIGSGLCQLVGTALAAWLSHRELGQSEPRLDALMIPGALLGVGMGAKVVKLLAHAGFVQLGGARVPWETLVLHTSFIAFLGFALWAMGKGRSGDDLAWIRVGPLARLRLGPRVDLPGIPLHDVSAFAVAYLGLAVGFVSGLLGVGGGLLLVPALTRGVGLSLRKAAGSGALMLLATAATGTVSHAAAGHVHLPLALVLLTGSSVSAQLGARLTRHAPPSVLRHGLRALVALAVLALLLDVARKTS